MKTLVFIIIWFISSISSLFAADVDIREALTGDKIWNEDIIKTDFSAGTGVLDTIFIFAKDSIFSLLMLLAVWMFLFMWARLAFARGNAEEFKKAMQSLIYAVVWLAVVSVAWATVKLVAGLDI